MRPNAERNNRRYRNILNGQTEHALITSSVTSLMRSSMTSSSSASDKREISAAKWSFICKNKQFIFSYWFSHKTAKWSSFYSTKQRLSVWL